MDINESLEELENLYCEILADITLNKNIHAHYVGVTQIIEHFEKLKQEFEPNSLKYQAVAELEYQWMLLRDDILKEINK